MRKPLSQNELNKKADDIRAIISEKITGKVKPEFTIYEHYYRLWDGNKVASTTTKIIVDKPHLRIWAVKMGVEWLEKEGRLQKLIEANNNCDEEYRKQLIQGAQSAHTDARDEAGNIGTDAHNAAENYVKQWIKDGKRPDDIRKFVRSGADPRSIAGARSVEAMFIKKNVTPVIPEILVGSVRHQGAGMLDILVLNQYGDIEVWDWKTSNSMDDSYALQLSAYASYFTEMTGIPRLSDRLKINAVRIVHLSKDANKFALYTVNDVRGAYKAFKAMADVYDWYHNNKPKLSRGLKKRRII